MDTPNLSDQKALELDRRGGSRWTRLLLPAVGGAVLIGIVMMRPPCSCGTGTCSVATPPPAGADAPPRPVADTAALPRLVDLGAGKCMACQMMEPVLEELRRDWAGSFKVDFIDVNGNQDEDRRYGVRVIPTQIFLDRDGKERFRHEGFFAKEAILKKWHELGISIKTMEAR